MIKQFVIESFVEFKCLIWDDHYVDVFVKDSITNIPRDIGQYSEGYLFERLNNFYV